MANFTQYVARQGQRWDAIAYEAYNDSYGYVRIVEANPQYLEVLEFQGGESLQVPDLEVAVTAIPVESLPPWRR